MGKKLRSIMNGKTQATKDSESKEQCDLPNFLHSLSMNEVVIAPFRRIFMESPLQVDVQECKMITFRYLKLAF